MTSSGSTRFHIKGYTLHVICLHRICSLFWKSTASKSKTRKNEKFLWLSALLKNCLDIISNIHENCLSIFEIRYVFTYSMFYVSHSMSSVAHNMLKRRKTVPVHQLLGFLHGLIFFWVDMYSSHCSPTAWKAWGSSNKALGWFGAAARNLEPGSARFREVPHKGSTVKFRGSGGFCGPRKGCA